MPLKKKFIKSLTGGISQQPHSVRSDNQCEEQINFLSDPVSGLVKRPGSSHTSQLDVPFYTNGVFDADHKNVFTHLISRSADEELLLKVASKDFKELSLCQINSTSTPRILFKA